ncbi:hypothetical protein AX15_005220 [Amanita polypyramis BW_CC]|nr:hypothetical protein AX15_005220 [Amanita polypyramis BW_CC]
MSKQLLNNRVKHPFSFSALVDSAWANITYATFRAASGRVAGIAEATITNLLQNIQTGQLTIYTPTTVYTFPVSGKHNGKRPDLKAELRVVSDAFWVRLATMGDLGFGEAYMFGEVMCDDLVSVFELFFENEDSLASVRSSSFLFNLPNRITPYRFLGTTRNSSANVSAHYDISNEMFAAFLSEDMIYTSAIYGSLGDLDPRFQGAARLSEGEKIAKQETLHEAQVRKLKYVIRKANILPGHRILDIGCGWGSLAIMIAETVPSTKIDAITLSVHQQAWAQERIAHAGLSDRITVHIMDYRRMPPDWENAFDRVFGLGVIEHIGNTFLDEFWRVVNWVLKPKDALGVVEVGTLPEARYKHTADAVSFIEKWVIFPGGFIPSLAQLVKSIETGSQGQLTVDSVNNISIHYVRTLREWRNRFSTNFETVITPALRKEHPEVMGKDSGEKGREEIEVFKRKWIYYFCYAESGYAMRRLGEQIITFMREGCQVYGCNLNGDLD